MTNSYCYFFCSVYAGFSSWLNWSYSNDIAKDLFIFWLHHAACRILVLKPGTVIILNKHNICSIAKSCSGLWDSMDCSIPGFPVHCLSVCSNSCPLSRWCYLTISSSAAPFSFCLQSFLASGSFPMSWVFASGDQSIGTSASVLPMNILDWFPLGLTGFISLLSKVLSRVFSSTIVQKASILRCATPMLNPNDPLEPQ